MGPDQVLVLVNGKRRHTTSLVNYQNTVGNGSVGTDMSTIPVIAIEKIEVLRDGAAAQYGSDAIAGVINIILKKDIGASASATYGLSGRNDGKPTRPESTMEPLWERKTVISIFHYSLVIVEKQPELKIMTWIFSGIILL
jgi:outer membrane receptor protein involved in Fe transport